MISVSVQTGQDQRPPLDVHLRAVVGPGIFGVTEMHRVEFARSVQLWIELVVASDEVLNLNESRLAGLGHAVGAQFVHQTGYYSRVATLNLQVVVFFPLANVYEKVFVQRDLVKIYTHILASYIHDGLASFSQDWVYPPVFSGIGFLDQIFQL